MNDGIQILKYPYPYKAWVTISNDPDNTTREAWEQIHDLIFNELGLPWANAVFPLSYNTAIPDQVNLKDHPAIAHEPIDTIHTWGDFVLAGEKGFSREDAREAMHLLVKHDIRPKAWVDHSRFVGNMLHRSQWGGMPTQRDASGWEYKVPEYTLDLVHELGIRYLWDGDLTSVVGQDREFPWLERWRYEGLGLVGRLIRQPFSFWKGTLQENRIYSPKEFPDGRRFYIFKRYGRWRYADIVGLADILSMHALDLLIKRKGAMIVYTHLGKSRPDSREREHIPAKTRKALHDLNRLYRKGEINFSSVSGLLDYLVIRDHVSIDRHRIDFRSDGIRFPALTSSQLNEFTFSFILPEDTSKIMFFIDGREVGVELRSEGKSIYSLQSMVDL